MPIRPALASLSLRGPRPAEVRRVACPHCGKGFDLSRKAFSATCPRCTRHLQFEDLELTERLEGDLSTMGHVHVQAPSEIVGRVVCGQLTNEGRFNGKAIVYGPVTLGPHSRTTGQITARSISAPYGALFKARIHITPDPKASAITRSVAERRIHHPVRRNLKARA